MSNMAAAALVNDVESAASEANRIVLADEQEDQDLISMMISSIGHARNEYVSMRAQLPTLE